MRQYSSGFERKAALRYRSNDALRILKEYPKRACPDSQEQSNTRPLAIDADSLSSTLLMCTALHPGRSYGSEIR